MTDPDSAERPPGPVFELVSVRSAPPVPPWLAERLLRPGVPRAFADGRYRVMPEAVLRELSDVKVVDFAVGGMQERFGVDIDTGAVVWQPTNLRPVVHRANSTIDQFSECIRVVTGIMVPPQDDFDIDDFERVADLVRHAVESIDDTPFSEDADGDGFWFSFFYDVQIGSY
jgi:hypothetical protein